MLVLALPRTAVGPQGVDSSELVVVATAGSLAHPPGYPLFSWLAEVLSALFPANPFATLATGNAVLQAIAAGLVFLACAKLCRDGLLAASLALSWVLFPATLFTATIVEVFALHHLLSLAIVLTALAVDRAPSRLRLLALGLLCGLGGAHQPIVVCWAPLVVSAAMRARGGRGLLLLCAGAALGLSPYLHLFRRFDRAPFVAFGHVETWDDLLGHVLRRAYGTFELQGNVTGLSSALPLFLIGVVLAAPLVAAGLVIGAPLLARRGTATGRALLACAALHLALAASLRIWPGADGAIIPSRFFPSVLLACALAAGAAAALAAPAQLAKLRFVAVLLLGPSLLQAPYALRAADARHDPVTAELIAAMLRDAPENAVLLDASDATISGFVYAQTRGARPDVVHVADGRLPAWWQRERLAARLPFLQVLDVDDAAWRERFITACLREGRPVVALLGVPGVPGVVAAPLGVLRELLPAAAAPAADEFDRRLLEVCSRWPDAIAAVDPARVEAVVLRDAHFLGSVRQRLRGRADEIERGRVGVDAAASLAAAARAILDGDAPRARALCLQALPARAAPNPPAR